MITMSENWLLEIEVKSMFCEELCPIINNSEESKAEAGLLIALKQYKVQCGFTNMLCPGAVFCLIPILFIPLTKGLLEVQYSQIPRYLVQNEQANISVLFEQPCLAA